MGRDADFTVFVSARWGSLVRAVMLMGCDVHEAEDVVQTALLRCYRSWSRVAKAGNREGYVYKVVVNSFLDGRRRRWTDEIPSPAIPDHAAPTDSLPDDIADADALRRALMSLSVEQRTVVVLRYYADLSEGATTEVLGVPAGTVKSRLSRALDLLNRNPHLVSSRGRQP